MKLASLTIVLGLVILSGCTFPFFSSTQKVIEHDAPDLVVDNSYFTSLGCYNDPACLPEALQNIEHPVDSFLEPGNLLGDSSGRFG